jgi:type IV pilus assembly protein PilE
MIIKLKNKNGFTLIELLIAVAIVGILSTVAISSYSKQATKSRRTDAKTTLYEVMQRQEKYMSENNTYTADLTKLGYVANPLISEHAYYSISAAANANGINDGVILTATPQGVQTADAECGSLILNSNGIKTSTTANTICW